MITLACEHCQKQLSVDDAFAGRQWLCPHCAKSLTVPALHVPATEDESADNSSVEMSGGTTGALVTAIGEGSLPAQAATAAEFPRAHYDFLAPAQADDELGRIGPYRVLKVLGMGGMGVVFLAEDPLLERKVALKVMLPALAASESSRRRFLREARTAAAIEHDHIVAIHQVGEDRGVPYIAMPLLKGQSLEARLRSEPRLSLHEVVRIGKEIASGLAAAHAKGLIHRDIKPANIWLEISPLAPRVKILDFGLARARGDKANLTNLGAVVGTPAYMAPEQASGKEVDARTDLFSLGCVLYRLCTAQVPFHGPDALSTLMAVTHHEPPPPCQINRAVPKPMSDLVMAMLAKDPQARPSSADEIAVALGRMEPALSRAEPAKDIPRTQPGSFPDSESMIGSDTVALDPVMGRVSKGSRPRRLIAAAAILLILVVLGIVAIRVLTMNRGRNAAAQSSGSLAAASSSAGDSGTTSNGSGADPASSSGSSDDDPIPLGDDRATAVWCVNHSCSVVMGNDKNRFVTCTKPEDIPPLDDFRVIAVVVQAPFKMNDDDMKRFAGLPRLETLVINTQAISDAGVARLRGCPRLITLALINCRVSDECFRLCAERFPELRSLDVNLGELTGTGMAHLKKLKNLTQLVLSFNAKLREAELVHLQGMKALEQLDLNATPLTNAGLALLQDLPSLKRLELQKTRITDEGLPALLGLPGLETVMLGGTQVSNEGVKSLAKLTGLKELMLQGTRVDDGGLAALRDLKNLRTLYLQDLHITDAGVATLRDFPSLAHLYLRKTDITDDCLPNLQAMKSLASLDLSGTKITPAGLKKIKEALAPRVEIFADEQR